MSEAFDKFIEQYNSTGRQKADGYDESHFIGLSYPEKQTAYDFLFRELPVNPMVVEWMYKLFPKKAVIDCANYLSSVDLSIASWIFVVQYFLYLKTEKKSKYQNEMIYLYTVVDDRERNHLVRYIAKTETSKNLLDFLKMVIFTSADKQSSFYAADRFLESHGIAFKKGISGGDYDIFMANLSDISLHASAKSALIARIESEHPALISIT